MANIGATQRSVFKCSECGWSSGKWVGRCGECQSWGTVDQARGSSTMRVGASVSVAPAKRISAVDMAACTAFPTGVGELDRVLGGGLVPGAVVLLAGEPGVGKSTLLLDALAQMARRGHRGLYVTGEESIEQVRGRAERIGALDDELFLAAEVDVGALGAHVLAISPQVLIVDSVQTMSVADVDGVAGGVTQIREAATCLIRMAKERHMTVVLVGHVTKDGGIAGPRSLEHLVDVVLAFEGDRHGRLRMVRAVKNRYGPTDEVGCFEMTESGISGLADPSGMFITQRPFPTPGTCLTVALEGRRPLLTEVQALVVLGGAAGPRRTTSGLDPSRMAMVLAVLERQMRIPLSRYESYIAPVGGARLMEPAADLTAAMAIFGSSKDIAVPAGWLAFGEVGLAGDLRAVNGARQRLGEAARLGMTDVIMPRADAASLGPKGVAGIRAHEADTIHEALAIMPWMHSELDLSTPDPGPRALGDP